MAEPTSDKHYEDDFEFELWKLIKQRAEEKDISYDKASKEVLPEFQNYLHSNCLVHEKHIPFYASWARKFLSYSGSN